MTPSVLHRQHERITVRQIVAANLVTTLALFIAFVSALLLWLLG